MISKPRTSATSKSADTAKTASEPDAESDAGRVAAQTVHESEPETEPESPSESRLADDSADADEPADAEAGEPQDDSGAAPGSADDDAATDDAATVDQAALEADLDTDGEVEGRPLRYRIESVLFACGDVVTPARLASVLSVPQDRVRAALPELQAEWAAREGAVDLMEIAGGWRFMTRPSYHDDLAGLARKGGVEKLSPAALETLAIVAYRQPLTRAEIEAVRGVQAGPLLRVLLDRDLIRVSGRSPEPGHPLLYGTTKRFLDHFGLKSLKALPELKDLLD